MYGWILFSGEAVPELVRAAEEAKAFGVELDILEPGQVDLILDPENNTRIFVEGKPAKTPMFVIPGFLEDQSYYSLAILRQLETIGVFCLNSTETILNTTDKMRTMQLLTAANLPVPKTMLLKSPSNCGLVAQEFGFPVVMKVMTGAKGSGVVLIKSEKELENMLQMYDAAGFQEQIIFQEFIAESSGRDIRVLVIDGQPVVGMLRASAKEGEFRSNFSAGGGVSAFPLDEKITKLARDVTDCLGLNLGGIDLLIKGDGYVVCEANSMPGFQGIEKCTNMNVPAAILKSIARQLKDKGLI